MNRRPAVFLITFLSILLFFFPLPGQGAAPGKVTVLLMDGLSLADLSSGAAPFLQEKLKEGAIALMTTNTAGTRNPGHTHATLGAGAPAVSDQAGGLALNFDEKWLGVEAGRLYQQLTGDPVFPAGKIILPRLAEARRLNETPTRKAIPCLLGTVLQENHLTTAVLGNSDPAPPAAGAMNAHHRYGPWLAADLRGLVDYGDVGVRTLQRAEGVLPWETDYRYLAEQYQACRAKADFIVLELGDFARLDALSPYLFDRQIREEKSRLLGRLDQFLHTLWSLLDWEEDLLIMVTPTPSLDGLKAGAYLTPCLFWGNIFPPGLLTSPTTRRSGLVANVDLAPTILHFYNLERPASVAGRVVTSHPGSDFPALLRMEKRINATSLFRRKVIPVFVNIAALLFPLLLTGAFLLRKLPFPFWLRTRVRAGLVFALLCLSALPLALHLASQLSLNSLWGFCLAALGFTLLLALLSRGRPQWPRLASRPLILPLLLFTLLIPLDLCAGAPLVKNSVLGYDPMLGARYYGIGNELAGLLLGSALGLFLWQGQERKNQTRPSWAFGFYLLFMVLLTHPRLGANFGAGLTALMMALILSPPPRRSILLPRRLSRALFSIILFGAVLFTADYFLGRPESQSHFGLLFKDYHARGLTAVTEIILRKLQVNLRLLSTRWAWLLLSALLTFAVAFFISPGLPRRFFYTALGGGLTGLLFNDSGFVFAALFFYPLAVTGLLIILPGEH